MSKSAAAAQPRKKSPAEKTSLQLARKKMWNSRYLYLLLLPGLIWYLVFMYAPLYGIQIAFRNFMPALGISGGKWVGMEHFVQFFNSPYFLRLIKNTLGISVYYLADEKIAENVVVTERAVEKRTWEKCMKIVTAKFLTLESLVWYVKYV